MTSALQEAPAASVRERPILFSGPMIRALLDGRKTQTRRVVTDQTLLVDLAHPEARNVRVVEGGITFDWLGGIASIPMRLPYGQPGDRLWVRETHTILDGRPECLEEENPGRPRRAWPAIVGYEADGVVREMDAVALGNWRESFDTDERKIRPSIHMPRWASRLTLEITEVRVERLQDISEADCLAEGIPSWRGPDVERTPRESYRDLWDSLNAKRGYGWDVNPFVWVIAFRDLSSGKQRGAK